MENRRGRGRERRGWADTKRRAERPGGCCEEMESAERRRPGEGEFKALLAASAFVILAVKAATSRLSLMAGFCETL